MSEKPSIDVQRRRRGTKPTSRAEKPDRQTPSGTGGSGARPGGGGPVRPAGGGGLGIPSKGKLGGCGGILILALVIGYYLLTGGGGGIDEPVGLPDQSSSEQQAPVNLPTNTPRPTRVPSSGDAGQNWLVMLYQDADDQVLEQDIYVDLNEAERVGSTDRVTIVTQIDRFRDGYQGDGNWSSTRRYLVTQDDDLSSVNSDLLEDIGEANMADSGTLVDFVTWAVESYPAERYVLIFSDHGMGWPGGWSDPAPASSDDGSAPLISALQGDHLYLAEIDQALEQIRQQAGLEKFDFIGLDACLMSQLEVYAALQPHARFAVASEETEPALGWAYTGFLERLVSNPDMSSEQLVSEVVNSYIDEDQRIIDDNARAEFLRQGSPMGGFFGIRDVSPDQLASQIDRNATLSAVSLDALPQLMAAYNNFAYTLQSVDQSDIASARSYAQSYTSVFGQSAPPSYIDLGHFVQLIAREAGSSEINQAASEVMDALNQVIVAERHGSGKPGSTGIALYFPNSTMYSSPYTGPQSYNALAERFVQNSLWDDFLAYHYHDRSFSPDDAQAVEPVPGSASRAPGAGDISISSITTSDDSVTPGETIRLTAEINGENIGYIYLFLGIYDEQSNSIYVADTDYLESPDTRELGGVYYPDWPVGEPFDINFEWDATLFSLSDGTTISLALFNPTSYGASPEDAIYTVNGTYVFAESGEQRYAQLQFIDGSLAHVFGFNGQDDTGAPAEITPGEGDTFTISQKWMELDSSMNVTQVVYEPGETLTFTNGSYFTWVTEYAPAGEYLVGFLVTDLDGNIRQAFTQVTVR